MNHRGEQTTWKLFQDGIFKLFQRKLKYNWSWSITLPVFSDNLVQKKFIAFDNLECSQFYYQLRPSHERIWKPQKPLFWCYTHVMCDSKISHWGRIGSGTITANDIIFHRTNFNLLFRDLQMALNSSCHWRSSLEVLFSKALKHLHLRLIVRQDTLGSVGEVAVSGGSAPAFSTGEGAESSCASPLPRGRAALRSCAGARPCRCSGFDFPLFWCILISGILGCGLVCGVYRLWYSLLERSTGVQLCFLQTVAEVC